MATALVPHPYGPHANPRTYAMVPTKDPLGFVRADNDGVSAFARNSALLYNHRNGRVHGNLIGLLRGGSFGQGVDHVQYQYSNTVTLDETTPVDVTALPSRIFFGALNTYDGYLGQHNDLRYPFPVVMLDSQRSKIMWQHRQYKEEVLPQVTVRSIVPSLRNREQTCEIHLQQIGGGVELTIESIVHGDDVKVQSEILRRILQLELSFAMTMNFHMTNALATAPSLICRYLQRMWNEADDMLKGTHPNPAKWVDQVLSRQLLSFCPSQVGRVSKRHPIRDLINSLKITSPADDKGTLFLATTSTVAELLMESNETMPFPESQRVFYLEDDRSNRKTFKPLQSFPGVGKIEEWQLPFIQVDGQKIPILKMPDLPDKKGVNRSSFVNFVTAMFATPIGYALSHVPDVAEFRQVDFNAVRMTVFDKGGQDGEIQWHRDILCRSGLNDPALFDPQEYDLSMLSLEGGEAAATAFRECFKSQEEYDRKVFSQAGITARDREFNLCVSNHVLYVGRSFGRTIPKDGVFSGNDPHSKFRATGIDGNRPLCTVMGYLQAARSAIANMHDIDKGAEKVFKPYIEACLRIPFTKKLPKTIKDDLHIQDKAVLDWVTKVPNLDTLLLDELQKAEVGTIEPSLLVILLDVFRGGGISKWMNVPRVFFAILEAANVGAFTASLHTGLESLSAIGSFVSSTKFQQTVEKLRDVHSAIGSFCRDTMASFAVEDTNVNAYIFYELATVVPVAQNKGEDAATPPAKLWMRRMFLETVMNLLATRLYAIETISVPESLQFYNYSFQLQVHGNKKRCETYSQPFLPGGFYTTYQYDEDEKTDLGFEDFTGCHPLITSKPDGAFGEDRKKNFYHSHVSRHFADLRQMYGVPLCERVVAALAMLRPHTPANALTVPRRVQTHAAAQIVRYGEFETHRIVLIRGDNPKAPVQDLYYGFIAVAAPVLTYKKCSNGCTALNVFMQTAPVLPNKSATTIQMPHYFCRGCIKGMGNRIANIQGCLDKKVTLPPKVFEEEAFAVPIPSCFGHNEFGVPYFPIDGVFGPSFLQNTTMCDRPDPLHTMEGAYSYNPMTRANAPSEIVVLNRRLKNASAGQVQLPPWSSGRHSMSKGHNGLLQRLSKLAVVNKEGMKPDAQWAPGTADDYLNITPNDRMCMFDRFYHPGPKGHEYGQKSRSILGENSNSSHNWTQTLETHHRSLNQRIEPLDQRGCERLINDIPLSNGFAY